MREEESFQMRESCLVMDRVDFFGSGSGRGLGLRIRVGSGTEQKLCSVGSGSDRIFRWGPR